MRVHPARLNLPYNPEKCIAKATRRNIDRTSSSRSLRLPASYVFCDYVICVPAACIKAALRRRRRGKFTFRSRHNQSVDTRRRTSFSASLPTTARRDRRGCTTPRLFLSGQAFHASPRMFLQENCMRTYRWIILHLCSAKIEFAAEFPTTTRWIYRSVNARRRYPC